VPIIIGIASGQRESFVNDCRLGYVISPKIEMHQDPFL
jgi:hypothetical protein